MWTKPYIESIHSEHPPSTLRNIGFWKEGDRSRAICESCEKVVEMRFEHRTFELLDPRVDVLDVLVGVCTECDRIVAVPYQSSPKLNEARRAASLRDPVQRIDQSRPSVDPV